MSKKMNPCFRKAAVWGLTTAMVAAFAGCGGTDTSTSSSTSSTSATGVTEYGDVTLTVGFNYDFTTMVDALQGAADRLNEKYESEGINTHITLDVDYQKISNEDFHNNIVFAHQSGDCPDIFWGTNVTDYVVSGVALDITDCIDFDALVDGICAPFTVDGRVYALPFDMPMRVMYYNVDCLKALGWSDEEIDSLPEKVMSGEFTFNDYIDLATEVQSNGIAEWGLMHRPGQGEDFMDIIVEMGGTYYDENGNLVFDEEATKRFFQFTYDNSVTNKLSPTNMAQMGWDSIDEAVAKGESFGYYGPMFASSYLPEYGGYDPSALPDHIRFIPFPVSDYNDQPFVTVSPDSMVINSDTQYPELCMALFDELQHGSADLLAHHSAETFSLCSVKAGNEMEEITTSNVLSRYTEFVDYAVTPPSINNYDTYLGLLHDQIVSLELGQTTPDEAIENLKTQVQLNIDDITMK
jgi:inositol-phosphate transport system substrate-binding protein